MAAASSFDGTGVFAGASPSLADEDEEDEDDDDDDEHDCVGSSTACTRIDDRPRLDLARLTDEPLVDDEDNDDDDHGKP